MGNQRPIIYLTVGEVLLFNQEILRRAGVLGDVGAFLRDRGLLESALLRPQNAAYYEGADYLTQAALYISGIALNHPFIDGNKRTAYIAGMTFLQVNGLLAPGVDINDIAFGIRVEQLVSHQLTFDEFVTFLR